MKDKMALSEDLDDTEKLLVAKRGLHDDGKIPQTQIRVNHMRNQS